jgi:hypothetical protein
MRRSWVRSKDHINTGRLCSAGSRCLPVPHRRRSSAALRLPQSRRPRLRSSLASGLPWRPPPRSTEGLPGYWAVLFQRAVFIDSAGGASLSCQSAESGFLRESHGSDTGSGLRSHFEDPLSGKTSRFSTPNILGSIEKRRPKVSSPLSYSIVSILRPLRVIQKTVQLVPHGAVGLLLSIRTLAPLP